MPNKTIFINKDDLEVILRVQKSRGAEKGLGKIFGELAREEEAREEEAAEYRAELEALRIQYLSEKEFVEWNAH